MWTLSHSLQIPDTPMWIRFNSLIYENTTNKQKILYLTTIILSPTNISVIKHTMLQGLQVAEECGETCMQIKYDLAIA